MIRIHLMFYYLKMTHPLLLLIIVSVITCLFCKLLLYLLFIYLHLLKSYLLVDVVVVNEWMKVIQ